MLRETMLVCFPVVRSADCAIARAVVSDDILYLSWTGSVRLSLQVDENIHEIGAGLENLGVRSVAALRLDHVRKLFGDIDVGVLQGARLDRTQATFIRETDPHVAGIGTLREDVAGFDCKLIRALHGRDRDSIKLLERTVLVLG